MTQDVVPMKGPLWHAATTGLKLRTWAGQVLAQDVEHNFQGPGDFVRCYNLKFSAFGNL